MRQATAAHDQHGIQPLPEASGSNVHFVEHIQRTGYMNPITGQNGRITVGNDNLVSPLDGADQKILTDFTQFFKRVAGEPAALGHQDLDDIDTAVVELLDSKNRAEMDDPGDIACRLHLRIDH